MQCSCTSRLCALDHYRRLHKQSIDVVVTGFYPYEELCTLDNTSPNGNNRCLAQHSCICYLQLLVALAITLLTTCNRRCRVLRVELWQSLDMTNRSVAELLAEPIANALVIICDKFNVFHTLTSSLQALIVAMTLHSSRISMRHITVHKLGAFVYTYDDPQHARLCVFAHLSLVQTWHSNSLRVHITYSD